MSERRPKSGLLVRLPLLLAVGLGLWLWRGGGGVLIAERTIVFRMPEDRAQLRRFEFQIYDGDVLLKRTEHSFGAAGAPADVSTNIQLKAGTYPLKLFRYYESDPVATASSLQVSEEDTLSVDVPPR